MAQTMNAFSKLYRFLWFVLSRKHPGQDILGLDVETVETVEADGQALLEHNRNLPRFLY